MFSGIIVGAAGLDRSMVGVAGEIPRVPVEVFVGAELGRVDEVRHDEEIARLPHPPDEGEMALVEVAHGGHEADRPPRGLRLPGDLLHGADPADDVHQP